MVLRGGGDDALVVVGTVILLLVTAVMAPSAAAKPDKSGNWQDSGIADAMMCDLDGDGTSNEYQAIGTVLFYDGLRVDGAGVTRGVLQEQLRNLEYSSEAMGDSIYVTGRTKYVGTLTGEGETLWLDDGRASVRYTTIRNADGDQIGKVSAEGRIIDGVLDEGTARISIDGPCGVPYEPSE